MQHFEVDKLSKETFFAKMEIRALIGMWDDIDPEHLKNYKRIAKFRARAKLEKLAYTVAFIKSLADTLGL